DLTEDEAADYLSLTQQIAQMVARQGEESEPSPNLTALLVARSRIIGAAAQKLPALAEIVRRLDPPASQALFYCGDGDTDTGVDAARQIDAVCRLLGDQLRLRIRRFTYEEPVSERDEILAALKNRNLDGIVAIRCLDEGLDLPDVRLGFLLAST